MTDTPDHPETTEAAALQRIAELDRDYHPGTGTAPPVDLIRHHIMRGVLETLQDADVLLLGVHLTRPLPGPVNDALRRSRWLREVANAVAADFAPAQVQGTSVAGRGMP